jgi:hypothetical protein
MISIAAGGTNWDSFGPDLIVGLVTGLVVGVALLLVELARRKAQTKRDARLAWSPVGQRLERLSTASPEENMSDFRKQGEQAAEAMSILDRSPLHMWKFELGFKEIELAEVLAHSWGEMKASSYALENAMKNAGHLQGVIDEAIYVVYRRLVYLGEGPEFNASFPPHEKRYMSLVKFARKLRDDDKLKQAEKRFLDARAGNRRARVAFINASRVARSLDYQREVFRNDRRQIRRDLIPHPARASRRYKDYRAFRKKLRESEKAHRANLKQL